MKKKPDAAKTNSAQSEASLESSQQAAVAGSVTTRTRPLLYAKFYTAQNLIALRRLTDYQLLETEAMYYNPVYQRKEKRRTVKIKLHVRLLDRAGTITWAGDVEGSHSDSIIPEFWKAGKETVSFPAEGTEKSLRKTETPKTRTKSANPFLRRE